MFCMYEIIYILEYFLQLHYGKSVATIQSNMYYYCPDSMIYCILYSILFIYNEVCSETKTKIHLFAELKKNGEQHNWK